MFSLNTDSFSCSCINSGTLDIKAALKKYSIIIGTPASVDTVDISKLYAFDTTFLPILSQESIEKGHFVRYAKRYVFKVNTYFSNKNTSVDSTIIVYTGLGNGDCGKNFLLGQKYIVFSELEKENSSYGHPLKEEIFSTNICTPTKEYLFALPDKFKNKKSQIDFLEKLLNEKVNPFNE